MDPSTGRRLAGATLVALLAGAASASPAAGQARCNAPTAPGWRSCLTASHLAVDGSPEIRLERVRPRLVVRYAERCKDGDVRRTVVVRTGDGEQLARARVARTCRRGVARWSTSLRLDVEVPEGTVVRSYWSGIADADLAPRVEVG